MGEWMLKSLGKTDEPFLLLAWRENSTMTIRKIREEGFVHIDLSSELRRLSELDEDRRTEESVELPGEIQREIAEKLGIRGTIPYDIRQWVSGLVKEGLRRKGQDLG